MPLTFHAPFLPWLPLTIPSPSLGLLNHSILLVSIHLLPLGGGDFPSLSSLTTSRAPELHCQLSLDLSSRLSPWHLKPNRISSKSAIFPSPPAPVPGSVSLFRGSSSFYHEVEYSTIFPHLNYWNFISNSTCPNLSC